jgi:diguanylate cyclase (GGDEF)-like protein
MATAPRALYLQPAPAGDEAADRDSAADVRDQVAESRDDAGDVRDDAAEERDLASVLRDVAADDRDTAADRRDADAVRRERVSERPSTSARRKAARGSEADRRAAASDRQRASQDRSAGAEHREGAERDRVTAHADRASGAGERDLSGEDRGASARDREDASLDSLTGAYVRGAGLLQLGREVVRSQRTSQALTVAFLDVDRLKAVNDAGGHAAGDRLLVRVAAALSDRLRPYDLVIRYGGDEFVCVLTGIGTAEAEQRFVLVNEDLADTGSVTVGVVTSEPGEESAALVARADAALYAKRALAAAP